VATLAELLQQGRHDEVWSQYCGFLDLSPAEFMKVQERLLLEELDLVGRSEWGKLFLQGQVPATVEAFRRVAPLTSYEDYEPHLAEKREDILPKKPSLWSHTSGRSGKYKWVPYTQKMYAAAGEHSIAALILSMARQHGEVRLKEGDVLVFNMPSPPYSSGISVASMAEAFPLQFVPPLELSQRISFQERMEISYQMALATGIDIVGSLSSVLAKIGERFAAGAGRSKLSRHALHPRALWRMTCALLRSRMAHRPLLPKDIWSPKGVVCGGTDTEFYKDVVAHYWGPTPFELYATTETGGTVALQAWNKDGLYFLPDVAFFEFIPEEEWTRNREDASYVPKTVLLDEVEMGQRYELVLTSFHGGPFLRYRIYDLIRFIKLRDAKIGIELPAMVCAGRSDGLIDLAGFTGPIDEPMLWRAIHETGIAYEEWTVRKEIGPEGAFLHLFLELKENVPAEEVRRRVHENLKTINPFYADLEAMLETGPIEVTLLSRGTFRAYYLEQQAAGADLAHLKPSHMHPSRRVIQDLQRLSTQVT
jgi:hypothetical protein